MSERKSRLHFQPERPIPGDLLDEILRGATSGLSDRNLQPWRFLIVRTMGGRERLRRCAYGHPAITDAPAVVIVLGYHNPHRSHLGPILEAQVERGETTLEEAREFGARTVRAMDARQDPAGWASRSAMMGASALISAARALGVGSLYLDDCDRVRVGDEFGIPADHTVCGLVALGYAAKGPAPAVRLGLDEVVYEEHFGQPRSRPDE